MLIPLPGWREPLDLLPLFAREPMSALLQSTGPAGADPDLSRWSILCAGPFDVVRWSVGQADDPFVLLQDAVAAHAGPAEMGLPFIGGAIGYIGYEAGQTVATIRTPPSHTRGGLGMPDLLFGLYAWAIVWDHHERTWQIVSSGAPEKGPARVTRARHDADRVRGVIESAGNAPREPARGNHERERARILGTSVPRDAYIRMVRQARRLIEEGELYQVNLSQRLELPAPAFPIDLARALAVYSPAPYSAWIDAGEFQIASASPERFVRLQDGYAESRPIKGTRPRRKEPAEDAAQLRELIASPKDRAENIMIVDLVRNDLGRVCRPGTVAARQICRPESYASVHHLVSIIGGVLAEGEGTASLLRSLFPGGSMTGAPKIRAMQAIADLEPVPRGVYSGALGYLSFCGGLDLSIVIRTAIVAKDRTWLSVGGGIVADSKPEAEHEESLDKAASVLRALESCGVR